MWPAVLLGALSTAGTIWSTQQNRKEAEKSREYQERLSSTAAERSKADYTRAGLNPALAYERTASSPSSPTTNIENPFTQGIASAQAARAQKQAMEIAQAQSDADLTLKRHQAGAAGAADRAAMAQAELSHQQTLAARQQLEFNRISQPAALRLANAEARLRELAIPAAKNTADFESMLGTARPGMASAKTLAEILKLIMK